MYSVYDVVKDTIGIFSILNLHGPGFHSGIYIKLRESLEQQVPRLKIHFER